MERARLWSATVILLLTVPSIRLAGENESAWHWKGVVSPDKPIQVLAVRGTVHVEGHDGDMVEIAANRRSPDTDPEVVQIVFQETPEHFQIITEYPSPPLGPPPRVPMVRPHSWELLGLFRHYRSERASATRTIHLRSHLRG